MANNQDHLNEIILRRIAPVSIGNGVREKPLKNSLPRSLNFSV